MAAIAACIATGGGTGGVMSRMLRGPHQRFCGTRDGGRVQKVVVKGTNAAGNTRVTERRQDGLQDRTEVASETAMTTGMSGMSEARNISSSKAASFPGEADLQRSVHLKPPHQACRELDSRPSLFPSSRRSLTTRTRACRRASRFAGTQRGAACRLGARSATAFSDSEGPAVVSPAAALASPLNQHRQPLGNSTQDDAQRRLVGVESGAAPLLAACCTRLYIATYSDHGNHHEAAAGQHQRHSGSGISRRAWASAFPMSTKNAGD